ncbi:glycosylhydrolase-like jelly roll fold domain-containing protein [Actinomadura opuntiae]|uniref:glycosylhydrolase-like jelly roll fold domain-containing protein n=1 Tax=Actinomadura sp. OS1-43 TaxID=604315 RepID=UPI00255AEBB7|nr:glycosylhydrolase-like jelly roll fold domain-containing protein [Actinomadura sp. OS1-43]MDL4816536.1 glycosyl hydrolase [Actinomadura sp. OS1-43]
MSAAAIPSRLRAVLDAPPPAYSPAPIWWWSGERLDRRRLRDQLERFAEGGVHNLVVLNLAPSGPMFGSDADDPPFFSDAWWDLLDAVCEDAAELGVSLWFYDQLGFSGADLQARLVRDVPAYAGQWLERSGTVGVRGFDYLSAEACEVLFDRVHGEFARRLGHRLGNVIVGSFQDELPSLPTWSQAFADEFARRRGYDLTPHLGALWGSGPDAFRIRRDYHLTRAELAEDAFFRPLAEWHQAHGLLHGCDQQDPARAGLPVDGVKIYADYVRTHRWFGAPGSDHHGDARIHSSLAHLYGRDRTWIEAFHSSGWGGTLEETFDWLLPWLRSGATLYNPHAVYYTTKAGWWEWAPPSTDWRQPYWRHHRVFADAVTRLCAALSLGKHVCDVAVLFPTATAQAGTRLDGVDPDTVRAQDVYRSLVGDMAWFRMVPGALDRLGIDADVVDDDSVQRAAISRGRLEVADESYGTVLLPACTVLEGETARRLVAFAEAGGRVIAVGPPPRHGVGDLDADAAVAKLRALAEAVPDADGLGAAIAADRRVDAPVPALVREVDGATVVFVSAAQSMASRVSVERPSERGIDLGWLDVTYDFDPDRYLRDMRLRVRGVRGPAFLAGPFGGPPRPLEVREVDATWVEVVVPFDDGPAALLIFPGGDDHPGAFPAEEQQTGKGLDLGTSWMMETVPTLDNSWGDFARPAGRDVPLECWSLRHRVEGETSWSEAYATFGPHGVWTLESEGSWRPAVYSDSRGIRKDAVHRDFLGPKGHVPEEFLDFGDVAAGEAVLFRSRVTVPADGGFVAVGAPAAKTLLVDGGEVPLDDRGYLAIATVPVAGGEHDVEVRFVPDEKVRLRAHLAVVTDPGRYRRPEWITVAGPGRPGARVTLTAALPPGASILQVASAAACRILVDGEEIGRQGGFDPYAEHEVPRVGRYEVTGGEVTLVLTEGEAAPSVMVDGAVVSGAGWTAARDGEPVPVLPSRRQYGDPASLHLRRRPHPLPGAAWLEDVPETGDVLPVRFAAPGIGPRVEWLRVTVPPGATRMAVDVHGELLEVLLDGEPLGPGPEMRLPAHPGQGQAPGRRTAELRIRTIPGHQAGAALAGPVRFAAGPGTIELGDWEDAGLAGYSGAVRYRRRVDLPSAPAPAPAAATLDLGRVRGTAEVTVNGVHAGVRICAPYRFDLGAALRDGPNDIEILVCGTLAPYLDEVSPTHFVFPGQRVSGLFGPVRLLMPTDGETARRPAEPPP